MSGQWGDAGGGRGTWRAWWQLICLSQEDLIPACPTLSHLVSCRSLCHCHTPYNTHVEIGTVLEWRHNIYNPLKTHNIICSKITKCDGSDPKYHLEFLTVTSSHIFCGDFFMKSPLIIISNYHHSTMNLNYSSPPLNSINWFNDW